MDKKLIEVLENILHWDTCPDDYKQIIKQQLKREENKSTLEARKKEFKDKVFFYELNYTFNMVTDFYEYWSEHNEKGYKMKFEMQRTWNIELRLKQWAKRSKQFNPTNQAAIKNQF